ncbi:MAG TPA: hypothetical protein VMK12_20340 [Anaeromyxobacteraceae bacterium]|nr:hypothetical protein [Anaeromyxobacteraceae bacterium]
MPEPRGHEHRHVLAVGARIPRLEPGYIETVHDEVFDAGEEQFWRAGTENLPEVREMGVVSHEVGLQAVLLTGQFLSLATCAGMHHKI